MSPPGLRADCARCAALCCVALAFDRGPMFAFDKAAGEPCRHLDGEGRCRVHDGLLRRGMAGCATYDCQGAGQYVTALFRGRSWRGEPALLPAMMAAFAEMRAVQEARALIDAARALQLPAEARNALEAAGRALWPSGGWSLEELVAGRSAPAVAAARALLPLLAPFARRPQAAASSSAAARPAGAGRIPESPPRRRGRPR